MFAAMPEVAPILSQSRSAEPQAAEQLLPLVYGRLRKLAAAMLSRGRPGHTLEPTGLVHEVYLRLAADKKPPLWQSSEHFFAIAAKTMRRILVELARQKASLKNGGKQERLELDLDQLCGDDLSGESLAVNEALRALSRREPVVARLVELHYFAGMSVEESAATLEISERTAYRYWVYARAWLHRKLNTRSEAAP